MLLFLLVRVFEPLVHRQRLLGPTHIAGMLVAGPVHARATLATKHTTFALVLERGRCLLGDRSLTKGEKALSGCQCTEGTSVYRALLGVVFDRTGKRIGAAQHTRERGAGKE